MWNIDAETLSKFFPEIEHYAKKCQSNACTHIVELDCAVKKALRGHAIRKDRYDSYINLRKNINANQQREIKLKKEDKKDDSPKSVESELQERFKVYVKEGQKILNIEHNLVKLTLDEKKTCLDLICKLSYLEILDLSKNGIIFLSEKINDLPHLKKLRIDDNAINTPRDKEFVDRLLERGIKVAIYSL